MTETPFLSPLSPFALGFYLGMVFLIISLYNLLRIKSELSRFRRHLSDKMEIEAETMKKIKITTVAKTKPTRRRKTSST